MLIPHIGSSLLGFSIVKLLCEPFILCPQLFVFIWPNIVAKYRNPYRLIQHYQTDFVLTIEMCNSVKIGDDWHKKALAWGKKGAKKPPHSKVRGPC